MNEHGHSSEGLDENPGETVPEVVVEEVCAAVTGWHSWWLTGRQEPTPTATEVSIPGDTRPNAEESATTEGDAQLRIEPEEVAPPVQGMIDIQVPWQSSG